MRHLGKEVAKPQLDIDAEADTGLFQREDQLRGKLHAGGDSLDAHDGFLSTAVAADRLERAASGLWAL